MASNSLVFQPAAFAEETSNLRRDEANAWRCEYPYQSHFLDLDGQQLHYVDESPGSSTDETVLMVHGNPTWSFYYRRLIAALSHDRRVIAVDHLGCGLSSKPVDYDYCLKQHIDNLCA